MNHPNVIKLLGACTTKGGPLCIIMEYAQYGSLRYYANNDIGRYSKLYYLHLKSDSIWFECTMFTGTTCAPLGV